MILSGLARQSALVVSVSVEVGFVDGCAWIRLGIRRHQAVDVVPRVLSSRLGGIMVFLIMLRGLFRIFIVDPSDCIQGFLLEVGLQLLFLVI